MFKLDLFYTRVWLELAVHSLFKIALQSAVGPTQKPHVENHQGMYLGNTLAKKKY